MISKHYRRILIFFSIGLTTVAFHNVSRADNSQDLAQEAWPSGVYAETWNQGLIENKSWVRNDSTPAQISMLDFSGRLRLADTGKYSPTVAYDATYIGLGTNTVLLPRQLNAQDMSIGMPLGYIGQWGVGIALGAGYAGNSPYNDPSAIYGMARISVQHPLWKNTELELALDYNGNRQFMPDVPLPFVEIEHHQKNLDWGVGSIETLYSQVLPRLWLRVDYFPVASGTAEVDYTLLRPLTAYVGFYSDSWAFHVDSYSSDQRLFMTQCRIQTGFKILTLRRHISINIGGGYAFNQTFSQGFDARDEQPVAQIANAAYVTVNLTGKF